MRPARAKIRVDGQDFFTGRVSCVLAGNVGRVLGGIKAFPQARPDDGLLELGVVTARTPAQWARTFSLLALGRAADSPFVKLARGRKFRIRFDQPQPYELDGGARPPAAKLRIKVHPAAITICVPAARKPAGGVLTSAADRAGLAAGGQRGRQGHRDGGAEPREAE